MDALQWLNPWQRNFPLCRQPFAVLAAHHGTTSAEVLAKLQGLQAGGALSRIGGVFSPRAGGAALLAAMAVEPRQLDAVAAVVSAHPGVNHNYEREGAYNLWFVMTARSQDALEESMHAVEVATQTPALRLRMVRPYRIDLGFDLRSDGPTASYASNPHWRSPAVSDQDTPLAALVEEGLPWVEAPFDAWAQVLNLSPEQVLETLQAWLHTGTLRRFGMIVRHHELGFDANAMTVFDVPPDQVDACGERLAGFPGVTLAYQRERVPQWPYNLYCMVHGKDRSAVMAQIDAMTQACGLADRPRAVLFSRRRFKQVGARRFRQLSPDWQTAWLTPQGGAHAVAG